MAWSLPRKLHMARGIRNSKTDRSRNDSAIAATGLVEPYWKEITQIRIAQIELILLIMSQNTTIHCKDECLN